MKMSFGFKSKFIQKGTVFEGSFEKQGHVVRNWKRRFFVLKFIEQELVYFAVESDKLRVNAEKGSTYDCILQLINVG